MPRYNIVDKKKFVKSRYLPNEIKHWISNHNMGRNADGTKRGYVFINIPVIAINKAGFAVTIRLAPVYDTDKKWLELHITKDLRGCILDYARSGKNKSKERYLLKYPYYENCGIPLNPFSTTKWFVENGLIIPFGNDA